MCGALGHTNRFKPRIHPINTEITLNHLVGDMIVLWYTPGTSASTGHAANAFSLVQHNNAILAFTQGSGRTNTGAIRIIALITTPEGELCFGNSPDRFKGVMVYLAEDRAKGQFFADLAMNFAGMAANTPFGVQINHIFVHNSTLLFGFRALRRTVTKLSHKFIPPPA